MQYLPFYNKNYNTLNFFPTQTRFSNNNINNYDSSNIISSKNIIQRKNSDTLLTAHNNNFENLFALVTPIEKTQINNSFYNTQIYSNNDVNISIVEQNYEPKITKCLRKYHSSQNMNILNLPNIGVINGQGEDFSTLNSFFDNLDNKTIINRNENKVVSRIKKSKISKIPHPKFQKKKNFLQNQINNNKENIININYNSSIYSNENINNNKIINDSLDFLINNDINSKSSIETDNYTIETNDYSKIYIEEEPPVNFKLSEFINLYQIGHG